jgi:hypothetical protein
MRIYLTHCCAKKDDELQNSGEKVTPDRLYVATPTKRFMKECKLKNAHWAIFSDKYGIWFPEEKHEWYEKDPDTVTPQEYNNLIEDFEQKLGGFKEIWFYHNPGRFHPLYERLLREVKVKGKITLFTHKNEIARSDTSV